MLGGRYRGVLFLLLSLLGALLVTFIIYNMIQGERAKLQASIPAQGPTGKEIVVAARDIPPGWTIKPEHLATRQLPTDFVPDEAYDKPDAVVGRVAMERILGGEFIREERLADPEAGTGMTAIIPRGMRAMQVPVKNAAAVSGFLNPGNFVDVVAVCTAADPPEVRTLLQSVTVLAVNDRMTDISYVQASGEKGGRGQARVSPSVTLALTPSDAEIVKHAFNACRITLLLRNDIDVTNIDSNDAGGSAAPSPEPQSVTTPDAAGAR